MAVRPHTLLSLCDGYGGTELALRSVAPVRTICRVERDSYAAAALVERMEEARLDQCPIWDDVATFDGTAWRGRVDIVAAGFPCPDFSTAGRKAGVDGEHWLWPECYEIIRQVGPRYVLLENVPGLVRLGGLTRVLSDLANGGFDAEWGLLSAAAVGAPHERQRWWLVAHAQGQRVPRRPFGATADHALPDHDGDQDVANDGQPRQDGSPIGALTSFARAAVNSDGRDGRLSGERCVELVNPNGDGATRLLSGARPQHARPSGTGWPPLRGDRPAWEQWLADGGPEPVLRRVSDGPPNGLADALHLGGNGLVPQCAAHAWGQLLERLGS